MMLCFPGIRLQRIPWRALTFSSAGFVTNPSRFKNGPQPQIRPDGDGPAVDLLTCALVGWPDLMAAITTAQAKNSLSKSWLRRLERLRLVFIIF
jgi:hypothetical protein